MILQILRHFQQSKAVKSEGMQMEKDLAKELQQPSSV